MALYLSNRKREFFSVFVFNLRRIVLLKEGSKQGQVVGGGGGSLPLFNVKFRMVSNMSLPISLFKIVDSFLLFCFLCSFSLAISLGVTLHFY